MVLNKFEKEEILIAESLEWDDMVKTLQAAKILPPRNLNIDQILEKMDIQIQAILAESGTQLQMLWLKFDSSLQYNNGH